MRGILWAAFVVGIGGVGCEIPQATLDEVSCTDLCACAFTTPVELEECQLECVADISPVTLECFECVTTNREQCPVLFDQCLDVCDPAPPPEEN